MKTFDEVKEELYFRINEARRNAAEARRDAPNSYGAGHGTGEVYALVSLLKWMLEEDE